MGALGVQLDALHRDLAERLLPGLSCTSTLFQLVRVDRNTSESGKKKGGGNALFVNDEWCNPGHFHVKEQQSTRGTELPALSIRPYYLPREFSHIIAITTYISTLASRDTACKLLHDVRVRVSFRQTILKPLSSTPGI